MKRFSLFLALFLALSGGAPVSASVQNAAPEPAATTTEAQLSEAHGVPTTLTAERAVAGRTLRSHWHVFIAFALAWALLFGYALSVGRRISRLGREVSALEEASLSR